MRHKMSGRKLNRSPSHRRALERNLTASFFEQFGSDKEYILTTKAKAKEYRSSAEKLITLAKKGNACAGAAAERAGMELEALKLGWAAARREAREAKRQRKQKARGLEVTPKEIVESGEAASAKSQWLALDEQVRDECVKLLSKAQHYRRMVASRLQNEDMTKKLFEEIAPVYADRPGGYTRVLKTGIRRLGDGVYKAMLAFTPYDEEGEAAPE